MKTMILALVMAGFCASSIYAQSPLSTELRRNYAMVKGNITKGADKVAAADYSFKATPQVRTFAEVVNHIANVQGRLCATAKGDANKKFDSNPTDKAGAVAYLKSVFDYCDPVYQDLTDQNGLEMVKMFGRDMTKFGTLDGAVQHDNEMYGTMVVYLRLKGLVPPSSEGSGLEGGGKKK